MIHLCAKSVGFSFSPNSDDAPVISDISFELRGKEVLGIMGSSGIGKTTLCRVLSGLANPTVGSVSLNGQRLVGPSHRVSIVFQNYPSFPWLNVEENVLFGLRCLGKHGHAAEREHAGWLLERVGLAKVSKRYPKHLSGGMLQRLAVARSLAVRPNVLILDEPFSAVDPLVRRQLRDLILELQSVEEFALILVTHDLDDVFSMARKFMVLTGKPARPFAHEQVHRDFASFSSLILLAMAEGNGDSV